MAQLRPASKVSHALVEAGNDPLYPRLRNGDPCAIPNSERLQIICVATEGHPLVVGRAIQVEYLQLSVGTQGRDEILAPLSSTGNTRNVIRLFNTIKKLSPLEGYNKWATTYHREDNPIKNLSDEFIKSELPDLKGKSVLDAGCGTGKICMMAVEGGASLVKGIDLSPKMIGEAKKNCPAAEFECADLSKVTLELYDVVVCGLVLGHIDALEPVLKKLIDSLRPGGHIILTDFHPYQTARKAKRTFKSGEKTFEVKHTLHTLDEYFSLLSPVRIAQFKEPMFNGNPVIFGIHGVAA